MRRILTKIFLSIAVILFGGARASALPEIMPLEKVQSGMNGVAYTIVDNSGVIEPFNVKIVGLIDNGKGSAKMIMAKASGSVIEKTGGVLQGMSGSPVYIDGKLVGALSAGLKEMNPYTFFITPIESMLKIWELPDYKAQNPYAQKFQIEETDADSDAEIQPEEKSALSLGGWELADYKAQKFQIETDADSDAETQPEEKSALFFSGFDTSGLNFLKREMKPFGFENFYATSSSARNEVKYDATLNPGSAMGVAVVCGDFTVGATGTVTAVDGNKILGFGHPFSHGGNVNFFMTDSAVIGSISGTNGNGMKIASVGNIIGRINQDRESGVAGVLGNFPSVVPITVTINDPALDKSELYTASIAYNESLVPKLGASIAYTALSKTADSLADSTVTVNFDIKTNVADNGTLSRQNIFYNPTDVGQVAIVELLQALTIVCSNTTAESDIFGIDVNMTFENERKTASLVSAVPDKKLVKPGETVNLTVTLQPYRKPEETIVVPYTVPLTRKEGPMLLDIHGGALVAVAQNTGGVVLPSKGTPAQNYKDAIKNFVNANKNNQLIVEPGATNVVKTAKELKADIKRAKKAQERLAKLGLKPAAAKNNKVDTGYIIDNVIQVTINVDKI